MVTHALLKHTKEAKRETYGVRDVIAPQMVATDGAGQDLGQK